MGDRVRKVDGSRFGTRKIRDGRVKWLGKWYHLDDSPGRLSVEEHRNLSHPEMLKRENCPRYDGRLDGLVALFYNYGKHFTDDKIFIHSFGEEWPGPHCINGIFCWETFVPEDIYRARKG